MDATDKTLEEAPGFWKSWKRIYVTLLIYWVLVVVLLILATQKLNS